MITEQHEIDLIEVVPCGILQIRTATRIMRDGELVATSYHRHTLSPGASLDGQDARVVAIANAVWTQAVIYAFADRNLQGIL